MTSWTDYYKATAGRPPRDLFTRAQPFWPPDDASSTLAIDLGCGDGTETLALLASGCHVLAVDHEESALALVRSRTPHESKDRLLTQLATFEQVTLPPADFIYAGFSLFFCSPLVFTAVWSKIHTALRPGGVFAGHLLGERDSWAVNPKITSQSAEQARNLFATLRIDLFAEVEHDGQAVSGPKHWHLFEIIARRP